jgi:hypothetical protein
METKYCRGHEVELDLESLQFRCKYCKCILSTEQTKKILRWTYGEEGAEHMFEVYVVCELILRKKRQYKKEMDDLNMQKNRLRRRIDRRLGRTKIDE